MATQSLRPLRAYCLLSQLQRQCGHSRQFLLSHRFVSAAQSRSSSSKPVPAPSQHSTTKTRAASTKSSSSDPATDASEPTGPPPKDDVFIPQALDRPLGVDKPPKPGQNTGIDPRTLKQRRDDLVDYDKHLERRKVMTAQISRPYYRDWKNMRTQEGKLWIAPERLFRADKALYFPNLHGVTLDMPHDPQDTTTFLEDRVSLVKVYSGTWALQQADSFTKDHEELETLLENGRQGSIPLQNVQINVEQNALKSWLIRLFMRSIRKQVPEVEHEAYFMITKGLTGALRESIGMLNASVGFVYLVDQECKIRWAGSANAEPEERSSLLRGATRLVQEYRKALGDRHWSENGFDPKMFARAA